MANEIIIILTNDYEIFGNGSGDVRGCLIEPTRKFLRMSERYDVPITLFVDVAEYWAFLEEERKGTLPKDYKPASWMREQLIEAIKSEHDVQLHLHPQWLNYKYDRDAGWQVDLNLWRLPSLPYGSKDNRRSILGALYQGKRTLEEMFKPYKEDYECIAFRAGAWCIQPEKEVLRALREIGIKIDSTVLPGIAYNTDITKYNFRKAKNTFYNFPFWRVEDDICCSSSNGIIVEIPIFTYRANILERITARVKRDRRGILKSPEGCRGVVIATELQKQKSKLRKILSKFEIWKYQMADLCSLTFEEMIEVVRNAQRRKGKWTKKFPVVFSGHSKCMNDVNISEIENFIKLVIGEDKLQFGKYSDLLN
ncbi:hypothetical protein CW706_04745 [Candidatus Bathyarchaeota archaeon]|nr:MAG: hypothetical protein CW706_04745 [Candidatus Bathyarchaeota archaeon]